MSGIESAIHAGTNGTDRHCTTANTHQRHQYVLSSENKLSSRHRSAGRQHLNVKHGMAQNTNETKRHHHIFVLGWSSYCCVFFFSGFVPFFLFLLLAFRSSWFSLVSCCLVFVLLVCGVGLACFGVV